MLDLQAAVVIVPEGASRDMWLDARGEGVTASEAWRVARGGLRARRTILEEKMNGSRFRGTTATRAGSAREAALLDEAADRLDWVQPNSALWGAAGNPLHRATPDGLGAHADGSLVVVEVKSHEHGWEHDTIPVEHVAQMQWQMHVTGAARALYGFEVRDEDDQPPIDGATWIWVERDEEMIAWLVGRADAFIAWRDAGCPDVDEIPESVMTAAAAWWAAKPRADEAIAAEKAANDALKKAIVAADPYAARFGSVGVGRNGGYQLTVSENVAIDEAAWAAADPAGHARAQDLRVELAVAEAAAKRSYPKVTRRQALRYQGVESV